MPPSLLYVFNKTNWKVATFGGDIKVIWKLAQYVTKWGHKTAALANIGIQQLFIGVLESECYKENSCSC